jgi:beta-mannosidase
MTVTEPAFFTSTLLNLSWTFKRGGLSSPDAYLPANNLPTDIHRDLLKNGKIADPFKNMNELSVRWIGDEVWTYRTTFPEPPASGKPNVRTSLKFEGLDTFATVYLNGQLILTSDNMFLEHTVDVTSKMQSEANILIIVFESARTKGLELVRKDQAHRFIVHQTEISRGPVRKAQYHWGWDWGPILLTCGPWKPVSIETYTCRISDVRVRYELSDDLKSAQVHVSATYEGPVAALSFSLCKGKNKRCQRIEGIVVKSDSGKTSGALEAAFTVDNIMLWWPRGYGSQEMYSVDVSAHFEHFIPDSIHLVSKSFGLRKVELVQECDTNGTSFYFRINNTDIFVGGSCWIPADSFLSRVTDAQYKAWVQLAADGNQTMLRIWGGGVYESDALYNAADELGILIWQDFAFACASYPTYPEYLRNVEEEARQNVCRLRNHPSLVLWAGNNEDYQLVERYELEYDPDNHDPQSWLQTDFPARYIYEHLLPNIIKEECNETPYHPSSPFGNGKSTTLKVDPTVGDVHQWNVWHGAMEPYQKLPQLGGRFVSEFGIEAYPHGSTLDRCITRNEDRYPGSMMMDFRNKAIGHERRLISYVAENFRIRYDLEGFTHLTQIMQADAISWAYKGWRRQWGKLGNRKCGGVLVWQLNDCWPTTSWAVVDHFLVPKPAYYTIKRAMLPIAIGVQRKYKSWAMRPADRLWQRDTGHIDMHKLWTNAEFDVWVVNSGLHELQGEVIIKCFSIKSGARIRLISKRDVLIAANGTTEVLQSHVLISDEPVSYKDPFDIADMDPFVVEVSLYVSGQYAGSDTAWPDPIKYLTFKDRGVDVRFADDKSKVFVTAKRPVKGFVFGEKEGVSLADNGFDIMPGVEKEVAVTGYAVDQLKWMYVGI